MHSGRQLRLPTYFTIMDYTSALFQKVPKYLLEKRSQIIMVLFVSIFAVAFINIFQPFGSDTWIDNKNITTTIYFLWSTVLVSIGMIVVAISRVIMYRYSRKPNHSITVLKYIARDRKIGEWYSHIPNKRSRNRPS